MRLIVNFGVFLLMTSCSSQFGIKWKNVNKWGYQLQNYSGLYNLERMGQTHKHLWVIDYSKTGKLKDKFSSNDLALIKKNENIVLSYFSIGEAEEVRDYFPTIPKHLLLGKNKDWPDNHLVKYWDSAWKEFMIRSENSYLKEIQNSGFHGVYLDIVDAFERFPKDIKNKAQAMADFIIELSQIAKKNNPDFLVILQNGSNIIRYISNKTELLAAIDGLAIEDLFFLGNLPMNNKYRPQIDVLEDIVQFKEAGKKVFVVEYIDEGKKIQKFWNEAKKYQLIPLVAERKLKGPLLFPND